MHDSNETNARHDFVATISSHNGPSPFNPTPGKTVFKKEQDGEQSSLYTINKRMDRLRLPYDVNENIIREILTQADASPHKQASVYWLTMARIGELALIVAGAYADGCEFSAAGDLLANPSEILVHIKGRRRPEVKKRHGKLSEQMRSKMAHDDNPIVWLKNNTQIEITAKALLPELRRRLKHSKMIRPSYLEGFRKRMQKIADVIGFLSAWNVADAQDLFDKMQAAEAHERQFVNASLCHFSDEPFQQMGQAIRAMERGELDGQTLTTVLVSNTHSNRAYWRM